MKNPFDAARVAYEAGKSDAHADFEAAVAAIDAMLNRPYEEGFGSGQRDMLAKCIAAVEYLHDYEAPHDAHRDALWNAISALRALQEKP